MKQQDRYHKWVEWCEEDQIYIGRCPDLITGIHDSNPVTVFEELCQTIDEVIEHFESENLLLPPPRTRPMMEVL
jgi:hypothetical protein